LEYLDLEVHNRSISQDKDTLVLGNAVTAHDFFSSTEVQKMVPGIEALEAEVASPAIRSRATLGGNIANASPVADLTSMLIALGAQVRLLDPSSGNSRDLPLEDLFTGYKKLALRNDERIGEIRLPQASRARAFSFEKAAKRARLDIAAVNTAMACDLETDLVSRPRNVRISAGGAGPVPQFLRQTSAFAEGKEVSPDLVRELCRIAVQEIHPISDVRGSAEYRTTMIERFIIAHFLRLFPESHLEEELFE
jgi:xanthine dehydrogenase small subunit